MIVKSCILDWGRTALFRFLIPQQFASSDNLCTYWENHKYFLLCSSKVSYAFHSCTPDLSEAIIYQSLRKEFKLRAVWANVRDFAVCWSSEIVGPQHWENCSTRILVYNNESRCPTKENKDRQWIFIIRLHGCMNTKHLQFNVTNNSVLLSCISCLGIKFKGWDVCFVTHQNLKHRTSWCTNLRLS